MIARAFLFAMTLLLAGCDLDSLLADPKVAQREADSKAIGSACRYGMRNIEDCYTMNDKASKSSIFNGWKEMDQYMRDNKIEGVESKIVKASEPPPAVATGEELLKDSAKGDKKTTDGKAKAEK